MKIITLTLNPVYDIFYSINEFYPFKENASEGVFVCAGGKGLNVSRALMKNGFANTAFFLLGKENCQEYTNELLKYDFECKTHFTEGRIRENITLLCRNANETRIITNSFAARYEDLTELLPQISSEAEDGAVIICSGKFPKGISENDSVDFVRSLKKITPYVVLDSSSFSADSIKRAAPWLIKPNEDEFAAMTGVSAHDTSSIVAAAEKLNFEGIKNILLSLGGNGAVFVGELGKYTVNVPKITPVSTVGAGDSMVAGFVSAFFSGKNIINSVACACAYGTAACLEEGNDPPDPKKIEDILAETIVSSIQ